MRDAVRLKELEDDCDVKLVFVEIQFGPGAAGSLSFDVMAAVARYYSDNLRSEVPKGMDNKIRQGWPKGHMAVRRVAGRNRRPDPGRGRDDRER